MQMTNKYMEKMFNITSHQKNANQNHNEILSHHSWTGHHQIKITNADEMWKKEVFSETES
jgi:hypothetical protein